MKDQFTLIHMIMIAGLVFSGAGAFAIVKKDIAIQTVRIDNLTNRLEVMIDAHKSLISGHQLLYGGSSRLPSCAPAC